jgi:hypothetical protein
MNHQIDVLILCQTLSDQERHAVLETAHTLQPKIKCALMSIDGHDAVTDGVLIDRALNGPPALLAAIGQMLQENTAQPSTSLQEL